METYEPSNSYDFEYAILSYEQVYTLLTKVLKKFQKITRKMWQKVYTESARGTVDFANRVKLCIFDEE